MKRWDRLGAVALGALLVGAAWYALAFALARPIVPYPHEVAAEFVRLAAMGRLPMDALASVARVIAGMALSLLVGAPLGLLAGRNRAARRLLKPVAYVLFPVPKIAFLPVFIVLFGLGDLSKVLLLFSIVVFHILIAVSDASREIDIDYFYAMRALGLGTLQRYRHLVLPAVLPKLLSSLKIGAGTALSALFFAENYATSRGLGAFVMNAWVMADYLGMYAGILALAIIGLALFAGIDELERKLCPWVRSDPGD